MGFPITIVNSGVSPNSSGTISLPNTTAGNLIVVVLGYPGTASIDIATLGEVISSTPSIWYCVLTAGGAANVSFASAGPGAWVFELACPDPEWVLLDAESATGVIAANNVFTLSPFGAVESMAALTGNSFNCCYIVAMHGHAIQPRGNFLNPVIYPAPGWKLHPDILGNVVEGDDDATTVCLLLNANGAQQFQLWFRDEPAAHLGLEHDSIGAVFGVPS